MKKKKKNLQDLPKGWTQREIDDLIKYYDHQSDEEGAAEIEAGGLEDQALVEVPLKLVPQVKKLIARHRSRNKSRRSKPRRAA